MVAEGRRAELDPLSAGGGRRAERVGDELYDCLARSQVGFEEVAFHFLREQAPQRGEILLGRGRHLAVVAHGIRRTCRQVVGVEVGLLGDASPFRIDEGQRREAVGIGRF